MCKNKKRSRKNSSKPSSRMNVADWLSKLALNVKIRSNNFLSSKRSRQNLRRNGLQQLETREACHKKTFLKILCNLSDQLRCLMKRNSHHQLMSQNFILSQFTNPCKNSIQSVSQTRLV